MAKRRERERHNEMIESAHKIWLAGLGSLAVAEQEGSKLFQSLVERGKTFEGRLRKPAQAVSETIRGTVSNVRSRAGKTLGGIESALDEQVSSTLHRLGVPTRDEISRLTRRVEELTRAVNAGRGAPEKKARARKTKTKAKTPGRRTKKAKVV